MSLLIYVAVFVALLVSGGALWTRSLTRKAMRLVPQAGQMQAVTGGALHYVDTGPTNTGPTNTGPGDGATIVLIHGLAGQLQHFTYGVVDRLKDDYRVIALDRPGCGYSQVDGGGASLGDQARMIDDLLGHLGVQRAVIVGHSLGGAVALRMALDAPGRVAGLALLSPLANVLTQTPDTLKGLQITTPWLRRLLAETLAVPMARLATAKVLTQVFDPETCPDDFMLRAGAILGYRPKAFLTTSADMATVQRDMPAQTARYADELSTPGAILFGEGDSTLSPQQHGAGMMVYGLSCATLPERGHMIPITAPEACADFIRATARDLS